MLLLTSRPLEPLFFYILILTGKCVLSSFGHFFFDVLLVSVADISKGSTIVPTRWCSNFRKTTCKKRFQIISKSLRRNSPWLRYHASGTLTTATRLSNGGVFPLKINVSGPVRTDPFWIHFLHAQKNVSATWASSSFVKKTTVRHGAWNVHAQRPEFFAKLRVVGNIWRRLFLAEISMWSQLITKRREGAQREFFWTPSS